MTIKELHKKLQEAYRLKNLNNISLTLIDLYKNERFSTLRQIAEIIKNYEDIRIDETGKGFAKLIKLYHPDRATYYLDEINRLAEQNDLEGLLKHSHILELERIEEIANSLNNYEDIDYSPVYTWDFNIDGFGIINNNEPAQRIKTKSIQYNFYDAIKIRQYGHTDTEFPAYYLEDITDLKSLFIKQ